MNFLIPSLAVQNSQEITYSCKIVKISMPSLSCLLTALQANHLTIIHLPRIIFRCENNCVLYHRKAFLYRGDSSSSEHLSLSHKSRPAFRYSITRGPESDQCESTHGCNDGSNSLRNSSDSPSEINTETGLNRNRAVDVLHLILNALLYIK